MDTHAKAFAFETSREAYDGTQCLESLVANGHALVCADGVVGLSYTWPIAVTVEAGKLATLAENMPPEALQDGGKPVWTRAAIVQAVAYALKNRRPVRLEFSDYVQEALLMLERLPEPANPWSDELEA